MHQKITVLINVLCSENLFFLFFLLFFLLVCLELECCRIKGSCSVHGSEQVRTTCYLFSLSITPSVSVCVSVWRESLNIKYLEQVWWHSINATNIMCFLHTLTIMSVARPKGSKPVNTFSALAAWGDYANTKTSMSLHLNLNYQGCGVSRCQLSTQIYPL